MKLVKRVFSIVLAFLMIVTLLVAPTPVEAATKKATVYKQVRINPNVFSSISVTYANAGDQLKNIKTSSKNLVARQVAQRDAKKDYADVVDSLGAIGLYAKKEGTYTLKFDVYSKAGKKRSSHKVTVYAKPEESPIASVKLDGKSIMSNDGSPVLTKKTSAKLSVKMTKGYKLKRIAIETYDKDMRSYIFKTVKNNKKVQLGKYAPSYSDDTMWSKSMIVFSSIWITYLDKYTKEERTATYDLYRILKK